MRRGSGMSPDGLAISRRSARAHDREHPLDKKGEHCERSDGLSQEPGKCEGEQEHDEESGYRREDEPCPTGHQLERTSRRAAEGGTTMALGVISKAGAEPRTKKMGGPVSTRRLRDRPNPSRRATSPFARRGPEEDGPRSRRESSGDG